MLPTTIFFCYAHEDEILINKLKTHLSPLRRENLIEIWYDRDINAGAEWEREIENHLEDAQIILLLISPDFMNSDYCYHKEMQHAMKRHDNKEARVIPIILRPVQWEKAPFSKLHALPKDGKPVTSWENEDDALADIAQNIRKIIEETSSQHFKQNLEKIVQGYQKALEDARKAGLNVCPECGSTNLRGEEQIDYAHDEIYHFIHCEECDWFDEGELNRPPYSKEEEEEIMREAAKRNMTRRSYIFAKSMGLLSIIDRQAK